MALDEERLEQIVSRVIRRLESEGFEISEESAPESFPLAARDGVFPDIESCIQAAVQAQKELMALPLRKREEILLAIRRVGQTGAETYGRMEYLETGLGSAEDNIKKNLSACEVLGMEDLTPEVFAGDKGVTIIERIPVGVIASVNPVTNGAPTILFNAIMMLAGGNTVVNNPHPKTRSVAARVVRDLNRAIQEAGGPANCICCLEEPSIPSAQQLMTHPLIRLIAVTGGHGVVAFATQTGKRVIAGGPGNPPVVVDETADLDRAARCVVEGASFSNCMACASEKEIFVVESVADRFKALLKQYGAYEITVQQGQELLPHIFKELREPGQPGVINMEYIGKPPSFILRAIGLEVGPEAKIVILETGPDHPLVWTEQIMPVIPLVRCRDAGEAINRAIAAEQGNGHTMAIHSNNLDQPSGTWPVRAKVCSLCQKRILRTGQCGSGRGRVCFLSHRHQRRGAHPAPGLHPGAALCPDR